MKNIEKFLLPKWEDGKIITQEHFHKLESYYESISSLINQIIIGEDFGLISINQEPNKYKIIINADNQINIEIINHIGGITKKGIFYYIPDNSFCEPYKINDEYKDKNQVFIALKKEFNPSKRKTFDGNITYCSPCYKIELIDEYRMNINSKIYDEFLIIGKLINKNNRWEEDINYLPPCLNILAHERVKNKWDSLFYKLYKIWLNSYNFNISKISLQELIYNVFLDSILFIKDTAYRYSINLLLEWIVNKMKILALESYKLKILSKYPQIFKKVYIPEKLELKNFYNDFIINEENIKRGSVILNKFIEEIDITLNKIEEILNKSTGNILEDIPDKFILVEHIETKEEYIPYKKVKAEVNILETYKHYFQTNKNIALELIGDFNKGEYILILPSIFKEGIIIFEKENMSSREELVLGDKITPLQRKTPEKLKIKDNIYSKNIYSFDYFYVNLENIYKDCNHLYIGINIYKVNNLDSINLKKIFLAKRYYE